MVRSTVAAAALFLIATLGALESAAAQEISGVVSKSDLAKLDGLAKELASKGRSETYVVIEVLADLGQDAAALAKTREACAKSLAKSRAPSSASAGATASLARSLRGVASALAKQLASADASVRRPLAEAILRLDDDQPAAHAALGHVQEGGRWLHPDWKKALARRAEIEAALVKSRKLEIQFERRPSQSNTFAAIDPAPATSLRYGRLELVSAMDPERLERILRSVLRAAAFSQFLRGKPMEPADALRKERTVVFLLRSQEDYLRSIDLAVAGKGIKPERAEEVRKLSSYRDGRGFDVDQAVSEVQTLSSLLVRISDAWLASDLQTCLVSGHLNWLCFKCFGTEMPSFTESETAAGAEARTGSPASAANEEKKAKELSAAGISGARRWLTWKAARGEDPVWSHSFVEHFSDLRGLDLLKSTFVVEYLQELSLFDALLTKTAMTDSDKRPRQEVIDARLVEVAGSGLAEFETRFDEWLLPKEGGVAQRLERPLPGATKLSADEEAALAALDRVRSACWDEKAYGSYEKLGFDRELGDACSKHVEYLKLHPDQLERWPDAHEEYADQAGFSAEGCWAGTHSVIAPGVRGAQEAVDAWMGTFYHRLPLLEPGLKRIGYGFSEGIAVLDSGSLVEFDELEGVIVWPPRDMRNVPTRFNPELPNPVPGADQSAWGYPITLQTTHLDVTATMKLVRGTKPDGPQVDCWYSTPDAPTNLDCAPPAAFCLIPKSHLIANVDYLVIAELSDGTVKTWRFTTGSPGF